jgi:rhodanese-related sulfurtransferase
MEEFLGFVQRHPLHFIALGAVIVALIASELMHRLRGIPQVSARQALDLFNNKDAVLLDIREAGEYQNGHLPQARNFPASRIKSSLQELDKLKSRPLVVYCQSGSRAQGACKQLKNGGFEEIYQLSGGLLAWQKENLPTIKGRK